MINIFDEIKDTFKWACCVLNFHKWKECYHARGRTVYKCTRCEANKYLIESQ